MFLILFVLYTFFLISCGTILNVRTIKPTTKFFKNYVVGNNISVSVGEPFIEIRNDKLLPAFEANFDYQPPGLGAGGVCKMPFITKGIIFEAKYEIPEDSSYVIGNDEYAQEVRCIPCYYIHVKSDGYVIGGWVSKSAESNTCPFKESNWETKIFSKIQHGKILKGSFKAQLVYTGMHGKIVRATYREFMDDYTRPAFTQELQWDLNESKQITFRSIKAEIIEATNSAISLKVLSDEDLPWLPK